VILSVDADSPLPPYEQVRARIAELIEAGQLPPGYRLPTVRQLAADLGVAPGTIQRAYRELELAGHAVPNGRHGTAVAAAPPRLSATERRQRLAAAAASYAEIAHRLGFDADQALTAADRVLRRRIA
jgi:GntR family transcriptional regulator